MPGDHRLPAPCLLALFVSFRLWLPQSGTDPNRGLAASPITLGDVIRLRMALISPPDRRFFYLTRPDIEFCLPCKRSRRRTAYVSATGGANRPDVLFTLFFVHTTQGLSANSRGPDLMRVHSVGLRYCRSKPRLKPGIHLVDSRLGGAGQPPCPCKH